MLGYTYPPGRHPLADTPPRQTPSPLDRPPPHWTDPLPPGQTPRQGMHSSFELQYLTNRKSPILVGKCCYWFQWSQSFWLWELHPVCVKYSFWTKRLIYHVWEDLTNTYSSPGLFHCGNILLRIRTHYVDRSGLGENKSDLWCSILGIFALPAVICSLVWALAHPHYEVFPLAKYFPAQT